VTPHLVYLSGPPAVGKSTLMRELTAGCLRDQRDSPFAHDLLLADGRAVGVELGRRRETFSGTDALGMSVNPRACAWITRRPVPLVLAEGDRLANTTFLSAASAAGYTVTLVNLTADPATLAARAQERGSRQNPSWVRGRVTKAARLADTPAAAWRLVRLDATAPPPALTAQLRAKVPALAGLS
jgi:ribose 1,5-bisphosphokinase PhnN